MIVWQHQLAAVEGPHWRYAAHRAAAEAGRFNDVHHFVLENATFHVDQALLEDNKLPWAWAAGDVPSVDLVLSDTPGQLVYYQRRATQFVLADFKVLELIHAEVAVFTRAGRCMVGGVLRVRPRM